MKKLYLKNNIPVILKENKETPRIALCFYLKITKPEEKAGEYSLISRLLSQGTKNRSAEELAAEMDENAIECFSEMKQDYIRVKAVCLNEDIEKCIELMADMVQNSTLADTEKEKFKLKGEIQAELDSPKSRAVDAYYRNIYANHVYGNTFTKILEDIDSIGYEQLKTLYDGLLSDSAKVVSVAGDFEEEKILDLFNKYFNNVKNGTERDSKIPAPVLGENKLVKIAKEDASQAQILMGWHFPPIFSGDYPAILLLNTILGASGLSSRLFVELRDKKGLAYVVRSGYETFEKSANFSVYIATEPKNIKTSLEMFNVELEKIKNIPVSEQELENAKNNLLGKREFILETNLQQASQIGFYEDKGLGCDFEEKLVEKIKNVSVKEIQNCADKYIKDPHVLVVLAPSKYLGDIE